MCNMAGRLDTTIFGTDLSEIISDMYTVVTGLATNAVSASVTDLSFASELEVGGEVYTITQTLIVKANTISAPPTIGSLCTIGDTERMVARWTISADGVSYNIDVADITTG
jgi:hypothetical protein